MPLETTGVSDSVTTVIALTTERLLTKDPVDVISGNYRINRWMKESIKTYNGGEFLRVPLMYTQGQDATMLSGDSLITPVPQKGFGYTIWNWKEGVVPITYTRKEMAQNSGSDVQIANLVDQKVRQAKARVQNAMNTQIVSGTTPNALNISGWAQLISASGSVGGVDAASYAWWAAAARTAANVGKANSDLMYILMLLIEDTSVGGSEPTALWLDPTGWAKYWQELQGLEQRATGGPAGTGTKSLFFDTIEINRDASLSAGTGYLVTKDMVHLAVHPQANFTLLPWVSPQNQLTMTAYIYFMLEQVVLDRRRNAVLTWT